MTCKFKKKKEKKIFITDRVEIRGTVKMFVDNLNNLQTI